jgi:hypothetical protein
VRIKAIMGKQTLADLSRNEQVEILSTAQAPVELRSHGGHGEDPAEKGAWRSLDPDAAPASNAERD